METPFTWVDSPFSRGTTKYLTPLIIWAWICFAFWGVTRSAMDTFSSPSIEGFAAMAAGSGGFRLGKLLRSYVQLLLQVCHLLLQLGGADALHTLLHQLFIHHILGLGRYIPKGLMKRILNDLPGLLRHIHLGHHIRHHGLGQRNRRGLIGAVRVRQGHLMKLLLNPEENALPLLGVLEGILNDRPRKAVFSSPAVRWASQARTPQ